jgi:NAD(P)-dependent dehydrogenase (short-subunit alcohol dehydrogenase family)
LTPLCQLFTAQADLTSESSVSSLFASSTANFSTPVQIVVVNHAIYESNPAPLVDMELAQWTGTMDKNLTSSFLVCREYLRGLRSLDEERKRVASIVLIGSTAGKFGEAGHADSKSGA